MIATRYGVRTRETQESLEMNRYCVCAIEYGEHLIAAIAGQPNYHAVVYTYLDDEIQHDCESDMELTWITEVEFTDAGHAIKWAISKIDREEAENE